MSVKLSALIQNQGLGSRADAGAAKNKVNRGLQILVVVAVATVVYFGFRLFNYTGQADDELVLPTATLVVMERTISTPAPSVDVTPLPTPTAFGVAALPVPTVAPVVVTEIVTVTEYLVDKIEIPVEVTRLVEVRIPEIPMPTPTVVPGTMRLCLYVEGVSGVFINDAGIAGNTCITYDVSSPVNDFVLRVTGGDSYVRRAVDD